MATSDLQPYNVDLNLTTVSGLSSGGFFAVQMAVSFSSSIIGSGIFAGGPYHCAQGSETTAITTCMQGEPAPRLNTYTEATTSAFASHSIDDPTNLARQRSFLFSGTKDTTVAPAVMGVLNDYFNFYVDDSEQVFFKDDLVAAHTQPTDDPVNKNACTVSSSPYLSDCDYDGAGEALGHILGDLEARNDGALSGETINFNQKPFITGQSMDTSGYVYVPASCASMEPCTLHVSFHGCEQGASSVGMDYVSNSGFNKWADTNNMVVLYPQAQASYSNPSNPNGCWDWWGYNDASDYDSQSGSQMAAVFDMMKMVASGVSRLPAPENLAVTGVTNTSVSLAWAIVEGAESYKVSYDNEEIDTFDCNITISDLQSGTEYVLSVTGIDQDANSGASSSVTATTSGEAPPLAAPSGLLVESSTGDSVTLSWDAETGAASYAVYRDGSSLSANLTEPSYLDSGLTSSTSYSYAVSASDSGGSESPLSDSVTGTTTDGFQCTQWTDNNYNHVAAGRATTSGGDCYCVGSGDNLGLYNVATYTTVAETSSGYYEEASC